MNPKRKPPPLPLKRAKKKVLKTPPNCCGCFLDAGTDLYDPYMSDTSSCVSFIPFDSSGPITRDQRRARKSLVELCTRVITNVYCVSIVKSNATVCLIRNPSIYRYPHNELLIIFGDVEVRNQNTIRGLDLKAFENFFLKNCPTSRSYSYMKNPEEQDDDSDSDGGDGDGDHDDDGTSSDDSGHQRVMKWFGMTDCTKFGANEECKQKPIPEPMPNPNPKSKPEQKQKKTGASCAKAPSTDSGWCRFLDEIMAFDFDWLDNDNESKIKNEIMTNELNVKTEFEVLEKIVERQINEKGAVGVATDN